MHVLQCKPVWRYFYMYTIRCTHLYIYKSDKNCWFCKYFQYKGTYTYYQLKQSTYINFKAADEITYNLIRVLKQHFAKKTNKYLHILLSVTKHTRGNHTNSNKAYTLYMPQNTHMHYTLQIVLNLFCSNFVEPNYEFINNQIFNRPKIKNMPI